MPKAKDYLQTKPEQLSLFELLAPEEGKFSNTVELYDFIPKYFWGKVKRIDGEFLRALDREFECRGKRYKVKIDAASITEADGTSKDYYPSKMEELVEDALRKLATEGQGVFLDDAAGVTFTLYQLRMELTRNGHNYSNEQIKKSLMICAKTNMTVTTAEGDSVVISAMFETLGLSTREDWQGTGEETRAFVRFNPLITKAIKAKQFRQFNYEKSMSYTAVIARQLHKRMAHHYIQASLAAPYGINLLTIIRDFGLTRYEKLIHNLRDCEAGLEEMIEKRTILSYKTDKIMDGKKHNKLLDAKFTLTPDPQFVNEIIRANSKLKEIQ